MSCNACANQVHDAYLEVEHLSTSTSSSARQSSFLTCGCFCVRGLIHHKPATFLLEGRTATTPGTSRPTLYEQRVGSLTSHVEMLNLEGIVRRGLRFIVLIREDLKV